MWSRFRKGAAPNRVGAIWHRRGRLRAIAWASRFFTRMMGHVARRRFNCAHVLYTRSHGASHRHADILKRMLQNYFEIAVGSAADFDPFKLEYEDLVVIVVEESNHDWVRNFVEAIRKKGKVKNLRFAVL